MARTNVPDSPIPQGPFVGGINRTIDRTIQKNALWDAQGVIQVERGRWRSCWEGTSTEATFGALTDGTTNIEELPRRMIYFRLASKLIAMTRYRAAYNSGTTLLVKSASGASTKEVYALDVGDYLLVCVDGEPARLFHYSFPTPTNEHFNDSDYVTALKVNHAPLWLYREWFTALCDTTADGGVTTVASGAISDIEDFATGVGGTSGPHGSGVDMDGTNRSYATAGFIWTRSNTFDLSALAKQGFWLVYEAAGGSNQLEVYGGDVYAASVGAGGSTDFWARVGINQQQLMLRMPIMHNGRIVALEGRQYDYTRLCGGLGVLASFSSGGSSCTIASADAFQYVAPGDTFIVFKSTGGTESTEFDYVLATGNTTVLTVLTVSENAGTTTVTFTGTHGMPTTTALWATRRALTSEERNTIYFGGRAADTANSIGADQRDITSFPITATDIVGEAREGNITALFSLARRGLIASRANALYINYGDLPLGSFVPANYRWTKIADVGAANFDCLATDDAGQALYIATTTGRIVRLYGDTISSPPISAPVEAHPFWPESFSRVVFVDNRLYCQEDATDPVIWIFDTLAAQGQEWSYTFRVNSGQDQTGTAKALEISDTGYGGKVTATGSSVTINNTSVTLGSAKTWRKRSVVDVVDDSGIVRRYHAANSGNSSTSLTLERNYEGATDASVTVNIYPGNRLYSSGDPGGLFTPYKNISGEPDRILVPFSDGTDPKARTLNYLPDKHNFANLCHGVRLQTPYETAGLRTVNKNVRTASVLDTQPMLASSATRTAVSELRIDLNNSEGETILARNLDPESATDSNYYECHGAGGIGDAAVSVGIGDGISAVPGELAECQILFRSKGRYR